MPFVKVSKSPGRPGVLPVPAAIVPPSMSETFGAAFRLENTLGSLISKISPDFDADPTRFEPVPEGFDPFVNLEGYEDEADAFVTAETEEEVIRIKRNIDRERRDRETIHAAGGWGITASVLSGVADPILLFPPARVLKSTAMAGDAALKVGAKTSAAAIAGSGASEALLHATQETRTLLESGLNIGGAGLLGGILGTGLARILSKTVTPGNIRVKLNEAGRQVDDHLDPSSRPNFADDDSIIVPDPRGDQAPRLVDILEDVEDELASLGIRTDVSRAKMEIQFKEGDIIERGFKVSDDVAIVAREAEPVLFSKLDELDGDIKAKKLQLKQMFMDRPLSKAIQLIMRRIDALEEKLRRPNLSEGDVVATKEKIVGLKKDLDGEIGNAARMANDTPEMKAVRKEIRAIRKEERGLKLKVSEALTTARGLLDRPAPSRPLFRAADIKFTEVPVKDFEEGFEQVVGILAKEFPELDVPAQVAGGSVGAGTAVTTSAEEQLKHAFGIIGATKFTLPGLRMLTSPFASSQRTVQELARSALIHEKNTLGIATPVPVEIKAEAWRLPLSDIIEKFDELYVEYRTGVSGKGRFRRALIQSQDIIGRRKGDILSFSEFKYEIGKAMVRGDKHDIPQVAQAAKFARETLVTPLKERAQLAKLIPEDVEVTTAESYLMRMYDSAKIAATRPKFVAVVTRWLIFRRDSVDIPRLKELDPEGTGAAGDEIKQISIWADRSNQELESIAQEITDRILGTPAGRLPYDESGDSILGVIKGGGKRGPVLERSFLIPDKLIEPWLIKDADINLRAYVRTLAPDVELAIQFGDVQMTKQIKEITEEAAAATRLTDDPKELTKIHNRKNDDIRDLEAMRDRIRHIHGMPDNPQGAFVRAARGAREVNLLAKLGGVVISSLPDIFRIPMEDGLTRTFKHAIIPMIVNLKKFKTSRAEAARMGAIVENTLNSRLMSIAEIGDDFGRDSMIERGMHGLTSTFGLWSGISPWNTFWKELAGSVTMGRVVSASKNWTDGTISKIDKERLASSGIDEEAARRINAQWEIHGDKEAFGTGAVIPQVHLWTDRQAADAFRFAIMRHVDNAVVTPGAADRPVWMTANALGRTVGQFRSFMFASHQAVLLSGLQRLPGIRNGDFATLNGMALMMSAGMMVYYYKETAAGREPSDDPAVWVSAAIDHAGLATYFFEATNIAEKMTGAILPRAENRKRYADHNIFDALFGPTARLANDVQRTVQAPFKEDLTPADVRAMRRLIPYQNLFYLRKLFDKSEQGIKDHFGIRE